MTTNQMADLRVRKALGVMFDQFQKLAVQATEGPEARKLAEKEMAVLLGTFTTAERVELRKALLAVGAFAHQR